MYEVCGTSTFSWLTDIISLIGVFDGSYDFYIEYEKVN